MGRVISGSFFSDQKVEDDEVEESANYFGKKPNLSRDEADSVEIFMKRIIKKIFLIKRLILIMWKEDNQKDYYLEKLEQLKRQLLNMETSSEIEAQAQDVEGS